MNKSMKEEIYKDSNVFRILVMYCSIRVIRE